MTSSDARRKIAALRRSYENLRSLVDGLDAEALGAPSYDDEWSIAQVLSHMGSQAEIMDGYLAAALGASDPPSQDQFPAIWAAWDSRSPEEQRAESLAVNDRHIGRLEALGDDELAGLHLSLFGGVLEVDGGGFARLRLAEHAVHTWDVAVALDPAATVAPDAVELLVDSAAEVAAWVGKPHKPVRLRVDTTRPERSYALLAEDGVSITPYADQDVGGVMRLPAEAFLRLVYGRLDPDHTPAVDLDADDTTLDDLRGMFPGV